MKDVITAFKEEKKFKYDRPWDVNPMFFPSDIITPPHYADTVEVLLCCGVSGEIFIGGEKTALGGKQVFYIAPRVVHSVFYKKNDGYVKILKINVEKLCPMLDIGKFLEREGKTFLSLPHQLPCFDEVNAVADVFSGQAGIFEVCRSILSLFELLSLHSAPSGFESVKNDLSGHNLRKIILWTENNYLNRISLDCVSAIAGYEKHYFCNKFKKLTGISYLNYVNHLRIQHACRLLSSGHSVSSACSECGFYNLSYFIQLFKSTVGVTPKAYSSGKKEQ